jgi:phosphoribosylformylglycinamidine synthase
VDDVATLKHGFEAIQEFIDNGLILSGHDRSDGGLITTLLEMAFAGNCGLEIIMTPPTPPLAKGRTGGVDVISLLFSEELGVVIEYLPGNERKIKKILVERCLPYQYIGKTTKKKTISISLLALDSSRLPVLDEDMRKLRGIWEETSHQLDLLQRNPVCVKEEKKSIYKRKGQQFRLSFTPEDTPTEILERNDKPKVAVIREEGSNGDREMASAFFHAGFETWDVTMTDFLQQKVRLDDFRGVAFVGGFSYADVLDSAKGWAGVIRYNKGIWQQFQDFYHRPDTFSLSVCNGCQLAALLGWVPWQGIENRNQPRFIHNISGRFESRFASLKILESPSIMLKGMENSVLGIWVAHGEGHAYFPDSTIKDRVLREGLAPARYADDDGNPTEVYPFNPNGSPEGIAALCSPDGRHLAIMPHPERAFLKWQWGYMSEEWKKELKASPWLRMFQNARQWCEGK